jgi:hypothetical protein
MIFGAFNLFRYITFRSGGALMTALFLSFLVGRPIIDWLRSMQKLGQPNFAQRRVGKPSKQKGHTHHGRPDDPADLWGIHPAVVGFSERICLAGAADHPGFWRGGGGRMTI